MVIGISVAALAVLLYVFQPTNNPNHNKVYIFDEKTASEIKKELKLPSEAVIGGAIQENNIYYFNAFPIGDEGPSFWALILKNQDKVQVIDAGNKSQYEIKCALLAQYSVPISMFKYCTNEDSSIINRLTHLKTSPEEIYAEWDRGIR